MEIKSPVKIKITSLNYHQRFFDGIIEFHEKNYKLKIQNRIKKKTIKIPFSMTDVKNQSALVRISGKNGIYVEDNLDFNGLSDTMKIESKIIHEDITNKYAVLDTIEIFFK